MVKRIGLIVLLFALVLWLPNSYSSSSKTPMSSEVETLIIPCDSSKEDCIPYFKGMLKYIRTFTIDYRLTRIFERGDLRSLFVIFNQPGMCQKFLRQESVDLRAAGVHLQSREVNGQNFLMLYNLNHRLMMSCTTHYPAPATSNIVE